MKLSILLLFLLSNNVLVGSEISLYTDKQLAQKLKNEAKQAAEREAMLAVINKVLSTGQIEYLGEENAKFFVENVLKKQLPELKLIDGNSFWSKIKEWITRMTGNDKQLEDAKKNAADFIENVKLDLELLDDRNINKTTFILTTLLEDEARIDIPYDILKKEKLLAALKSEKSSAKESSEKSSDMQKEIAELKNDLKELVEKKTNSRSLDEKRQAVNIKRIAAVKKEAANKLLEENTSRQKLILEDSAKKVQETLLSLQKLDQGAKHNLAESAQKYKVAAEQARISGLTHDTSHIPATTHSAITHLGIS